MVTKLIQEIKFYLQHIIKIFPQSTPKLINNIEFKEITLFSKFNCAREDSFILPHSIIETTQNFFQKIIELENHKHWILKKMTENPTEINTIHSKRWLDSIYETLDFYILTLQNIICEISLLTESQPYKCNYQINFDDFPLITLLESYKYYGWLYGSNTVKQVEFPCENDSTLATTISNKGILQLHPSCRIKNHNFSNQTIPLKYLEPNISKPLFDISLNLISPFF